MSGIKKVLFSEAPKGPRLYVIGGRAYFGSEFADKLTKRHPKSVETAKLPGVDWRAYVEENGLTAVGRPPTPEEAAPALGLTLDQMLDGSFIIDPLKPPSHVHPASDITSGELDDVRIPDVETLSYGGPFAVAQIPDTVRVRTPYVGDETEVTETSAAYASKKTLRVVRNSANLVTPSTLLVEIGGKVTSGDTLTIGIFVDGAERITQNWTETAYTLKSGTYNISGWSNGVHDIDLRMRVSAGTGYNRIFEVYLK